MNKIKAFFRKLKEYWIKLKSKFIKLHKLTISYNHTWGDSDDQTYIVKKFLVTKEKYIKFRTESNQIVELRGAEGLNYRIEEL